MYVCLYACMWVGICLSPVAAVLRSSSICCQSRMDPLDDPEIQRLRGRPEAGSGRSGQHTTLEWRTVQYM